MKRRCIDSHRVGEPGTIIPVGNVGKGKPNGMFFMYIGVIRAAEGFNSKFPLSCLRFEDAVGMGGAKGNQVIQPLHMLSM